MKLQKLFKERLSLLNEEQKKAVESMEGPVMVIAGPGTGKTEVLGARISNILHTQTDINAKNILCLTYTNAGVIAMRQRLFEFIGSESHNIEIHTFHSFCNKIIQENNDYFPVKDLENISELNQYEIIENLLLSLPAEDPHFKKNSFIDAKKLLSIFNVFKSENWTIDILLTSVKEGLENLNTDETLFYKRKYTCKKSNKIYEKGDINEKKYNNKFDKIKKLESAIFLFKKYNKSLKESGQYDFQDMILWIIEAFEKDVNFLCEYQEQFQYVLVDEFQDTNGSQKKIIDYLCSYWDSPNIFVVGDDDQSIYRFQGANMRNIIDFYNQYKNDIKLITLDKNYRSSQEILDLSKNIINKNSERLESEISFLNKNLFSKNNRFLKIDNPKPLLKKYYNEYHEDFGIFIKIKELQKKGINLSNIAILYQNHKQAENLLKLFEKNKIPVKIKETQNILEQPLIKNIILILEYFYKESVDIFSGDYILFKILYLPFFNISNINIINFAIDRKREIKEKNKKNIYFKKLLFDIDDEKNPLYFLKNIMETLEKKYINSSLLIFLENIFTNANIIKWILQQNNKDVLFKELSSFFHFIKNLCSKNNFFSLKDLFSILKRMENHNIKIPIEKIYYEKDGVNFITTHSSKGLEFEYIFLKGVNKNIWDKQKPQSYFIPDSLPVSNNGDFLEEKRRLFFVALTRAKKHLEVSCSTNSLEGKELDPSIFIAEMQEFVTPEIIKYADELIEEVIVSELFLENIPVNKDNIIIDNKSMSYLLDGYILSPTHLNKYLECPKKFYYENLLQIPSSMSNSACFGSAIHYALEKGINDIENNNKLTSSKFIEYYIYSLEKFKYLFEEKEYLNFIKHGEHVLKKYYNEKILIFDKSIRRKSEQKIITGLNNLRIKGNIDRLDIVDNNIFSIIDYKTGNPLSTFTKEKLLPPSEKNNFLGGDYWRQMVFYSILVENNFHLNKNISYFIFDFIEPLKGIFYSHEIFVTEECKAKVKDQIKYMYENINNGNFEGCMKPDCYWCSI
jgi:DNA helicase-2/ATP-dependent DNA helicase PcrA